MTPTHFINTLKQFDTAWLYLDPEGEFHVSISRGHDDPQFDDQFDWLCLGGLFPDEKMSAAEFYAWIVDGCPDDEFPSALTDGEIQEIRDLIQHNALGDDDG